MRALFSGILILAVSSLGSAQEAPKPSDRWTLLPGFWTSVNSKPKPAKPKFFAVQSVRPSQAQEARKSTCAVPLLRAEIPDNVIYTMTELMPPPDPLSTPKAILPALPCQ
jgi:hypothetical protein